MISKRSSKWLMLAVFVLAVPISALAAKKTQVAPGKYEHWGPDIDQIEIVSSFKASDYATIVVEPVDTSSTPAPEDRDMTEKVEKVLRDARTPLIEGVQKKISGLEVVESIAADKSKTLILRTKVTLMDPGSRSKRMWIGYGAGAARAAVEGEIVDAATGNVLVRFVQERRSGVERFGRGSSYEEIMKRNLVAIGQDVANLLKEI